MKDRRYVILRKDLDTREICGYCENSFSMSFKMNLYEVKKWLKSIKERYTWKSSDLPHWKKSTLPNDNTTGFNIDNFCYKGYYINYKELFEKLPKDE